MTELSRRLVIERGQNALPQRGATGDPGLTCLDVFPLTGDGDRLWPFVERNGACYP